MTSPCNGGAFVFPEDMKRLPVFTGLWLVLLWSLAPADAREFFVYFGTYTTAKTTIKQMSENHEKLNHWFNNVMVHVGPLFGWNVKGCADQADTVLNKLLDNSYDDTWHLSQVQVLHLSLAPSHQFLILKSDSPAYPVILIDSYYNKIKTIMKPGETYHGILIGSETYIKPPGQGGYDYTKKTFY
jgi:hypothetical protein